jgi:hypothetical protein
MRSTTCHVETIWYCGALGGNHIRHFVSNHNGSGQIEVVFLSRQEQHAGFRLSQNRLNPIRLTYCIG